jgi:hypothetical protein
MHAQQRLTTKELVDILKAYHEFVGLDIVALAKQARAGQMNTRGQMDIDQD